MSEDSEDFLYLSDEEGDSASEKPLSKKISIPKISIPKRKRASHDRSSNPPTVDPPDSDGIELSLDGIFKFEWEIRGMDCPDCAMKASRAVNRLPGIQHCRISVANGTVEISQDISDGAVSRASSVLSSLGHAPEMGWLRAVGVNPERVALRLGMDNKGLKNSILSIPGTLDTRINDRHIDIQRVWISDPKLRMASDKKMAEILGEEYRLSPTVESGFRKDQIQLLAAILSIPLIMLVFAIEASERIPVAVSWFLALGGIAFAGNQMFKEAIAGLKNRVVGFQVLTSLAVVGAIALGEMIEALMVVSLVAFASHLENRALIRARESMQGGLDRLPRSARVVSINDKQIETGGIRSLNVINTISMNPSSVQDCDNDLVPVEALEVGEMIEVRSGETVPVDGVIIEGNGAIDRAPLTGEPIPIPVKLGDRVEAGLVLARGPLVIKSEATGDDTRLSSLIDLVRHYKDQPTRTQSVIEKFTIVWTPLVVFASPIIGFLFTNSAEQAILTTLLLWVVSCPCSLLLASPVPHAAALTTASGFGLIARGGDVLESAAQVNLALLDKTGTLTSGRPTISGISVARGEDESRVLRIAAGLEARSNHPYASTIIQEAEVRSLKPMGVTQIKDGDAGVFGVHRGDSVMLGRADWIRSQEISIPDEIEDALENSRNAGKGASILSVGDSAIAMISFAHDDAREGVLETIDELRTHGVRVEILSGDEQASVEAFASEIGIDPALCKGGVDPEGKAEYVTQMSTENRTIMAGDGFNDAGALAAADVGVAIGSGDQVNLDAADILIPGQDPRVLSKMVNLAKRTRLIVYANIAISVVVTMILVTAVLAGFDINLAAGIALHEASAIIIILNGMWVSGTGTQRLSSLADLARDIFSDLIEIWAILYGNDSKTNRRPLD